MKVCSEYVQDDSAAQCSRCFASQLKARAALAGLSLSDYLLMEIKEIAERPTLAEFRKRLRKREPLSVRSDAARLVREERETR